MKKLVLKVETMRKMKVKTTDNSFSEYQCATKKFFFFSKFMFLLVILVEYMFLF